MPMNQTRTSLLVMGLIVAGFMASRVQAQVTFYTDESAWLAAVTGVELLTTDAAGVALANEVASPPMQNDFLGPILTFDSANTGFSRNFTVETLQTSAEFTFSDGEPSPVSPGFADALSVGDINNQQDDDVRWTFTSGPALTAFAFEVGDNNEFATDQVIVYDSLGGTLATLTGTPELDNDFAFIGITSTQPIGAVEYNDDAAGDDISVADFRFATAIPEPTAVVLAGLMASVALFARGRHRRAQAS